MAGVLLHSALRGAPLHRLLNKVRVLRCGG